MLYVLQVDNFGRDCEASGESGAGTLNLSHDADRAETRAREREFSGTNDLVMD